MITEGPVYPLLELETFEDDAWVTRLADANTVDVKRGGKRSGVTSTVDVGTLTCTFVNAGDPLAGGTLQPNMPVRIGLTDAAIFTGRIVDVGTRYILDKRTGQMTTHVTISAVDSVSAHVATTRYGAVTEDAAGFESWANRIIRLSASATTDINPPEDDDPIVRYGI